MLNIKGLNLCLYYTAYNYYVFNNELGRRITAATSDVKETSYLYQRIYVALPRFNAICIYNTFRNVLYDDDSC